MAVFANFAALVADQTGTTLTQADADALELLLDKMLFIDGKNVGPLLKEALTVTDVDGAVAGESRVNVENASQTLQLDVKVLSSNKVEVELLRKVDGVFVRKQRITEDAVFSYA